MNVPYLDIPKTSASNDLWTLLKRPDPPQADARWLRWHPSELDACLEARAAQLPAPLAAEEIAEMREQHARWGADQATLDALDRLADPAARVIVTGQQPALLAGPLLVVYKTMAAIDLARRLAQRRPELHFVPVFWVASEDHDFDEIRRVFWPGHSGQLEEFLISQSLWNSGQMIGGIPTESLVSRLKAQIDASTYKTEFGSEIFSLVEEAYGGKETLESGFCRLMLRIFAGTGLVIVSPLARWVRRRAAAILRTEFEAPGVSSRALIERGEALANAGITPSLHRVPEAINAFWVDNENRRHTLRLENGEVQRALPQNDEANHIDQPPIPPDGLLRMLAEDPMQFSANVVTRPLVQDAILPTVAQVVGPGEAAYLGQVETVYPRFGVFAPVRWPRPQAILVEPRVARNLEKFRIAIDDILNLNSIELFKMIVQRDLESTELHAVEEIRQHQFGELEELRKKFGTNNPAVDSAFEKLLTMMAKGYGKITERMLYQRQQDERSLNLGIAMLQNCLQPNSQPQERMLNPIVPFAFNYSLDWIARLAERIQNDPTLPVQVFELSELARPEGESAPKSEDAGSE